MAKVYGKKYVNGVVARHHDVQDALRRKAERGEMLTKRNLEVARAASPHHKIFGPGHLTEVESARCVDSKYPTDWRFTLVAYNTGKREGASGNVALHLEYGHQPSGVFEDTDTKPPAGLYILTQAYIAM